jgi:SAM-dependent methyltransferase
MKNSDSNTSWDDLWKDGLTPWDLGKPTPLLIDELEKQRTTTMKKRQQMRTLVPGCGTGYDLLTLQSHHNYMAIQQQQQENSTSMTENVVVGLDMSATALQSAERLVEGHVSNLTRLELQCGDFFDAPATWKTVYSSTITDQDCENNEADNDSPKEFDFIFDYTFFCALPPSLRSNWGAQISSLLNPTNGRLLTVIFSILPPGAPMQGPPYPVTVQDYVDALTPHGIIMDGEPFESALSVSSRAGKETVCYWKFGSESGSTE